MKSAFIPFDERLALIDEVIKPGLRRSSGPATPCGPCVFDEVGGPLAVRRRRRTRSARTTASCCGSRATGVCRSDWHAWEGHEDVALPHVPGHELAGVVESVGPR